MDNNRVYSPPLSLVDFFLADNFVNLVCGPVGCLPADTEVLTGTGWVRMDRWSGQPIAEWSPDGRVTLRAPLEYVKKPCADFIRFSSKHSMDMVLSDEHRVPHYDYKGKFKVKTAAELAAKPSSNTIPVTFYRHGDTLEMSDDEIRLWVAVAADGHYPARGQQCHITVRKDRKKERLAALLRRLGIAFTQRTRRDCADEARFTFARPAHPKHFDARWWQASSRELGVMLDELDYWDGLADHAEKRFSTSHRDQAEIVQFAAHACGRRATIRETAYPGKSWASTFTVQITTTAVKTTVKLSKRHVDIERVPAVDGFKYCFRTSTGFFVARHNGRVFCTGNSTKTTAGLMRIVRYAKAMAPGLDGIRRSRIVWVRRSRQILDDTSIKDFHSWFPPGIAGEWAKTDRSFTLRFDDVECEVLFRPLEDAQDVNRVLSLQLSAAVIDEFREISKEVYEGLLGRLGRFPDKRMVPPRPEWGVDDKGNPIGGCVREDGAEHKQMWGMTNPPDAETFWEELLTNPPDNVSVFMQPSALSEEADWLQFLPSGYYETLAEGKSEDWVDVYIRNKFGRSLSGLPVFRSYARETHNVSDLLVLPGQPVILGVDAGLSPAAVFGQQTYNGRLLVHSAIISEGMGALRFIREKVRPKLTNMFPGHAARVIIDPAARQRSQADERTVADMYRAEGFQVDFASTNGLAARLGAVDNYLTRTVEGMPAIVFGPDTLPLRAALGGKYRYKINTRGEAADEPEKSHPWSDVADGLQYLCLDAGGGAFMGAQVQAQRREIKPAPYRWV